MHRQRRQFGFFSERGGLGYEGPALIHDGVEHASKFLLTGARKSRRFPMVAGSSRAEDIAVAL